MQQWLVYRENQTIGPMASSDLKRLAASGELLPSEIVGLAGSSERFAASKVNGLFPQAAAEPPIPPSESQTKGVDAKRVAESFRSFASDAKDYAKDHIGTAATAAREASEKARRADDNDQETSTVWHLLTGALRLPAKQKAILAIIWLLPGLAISSCLRLPSDSVSTTVAQSAGSIPMTVDELRKSLRGGTSFSPKSKFYDKYGKPKRTIDPSNGTAVYLLYDCTDNPVRIECASGSFRMDEIWILSIRET